MGAGSPGASARRLMAALTLLAAMCVAAGCAGVAPSPGSAAAGAAGGSAAGAESRRDTAAAPDGASSARPRVEAGDSAIFLSWSAPWGGRRAARERAPACADSARADTLYLTVRLGSPANQVTGFAAKLMVRATGTDSLGDWWRAMGKGGANAAALRVEWASQHDWGSMPAPFRVPGQGFFFIETSPFTAKLQMIFAVAEPDAQRADGEPLYGLARVILEHAPQQGLEGCSQPVVIEWVDATIATGSNGEHTLSRGERFVSFAGPYALTEPFRASRTKAWRPGGTSAR